MLVALACTDAPRPPAATASGVARDSAGVRILESRADGRRPAAWAVGEAPVWSVGAVDGDPAYLLDGVVGARKLPGGRTVVANRGTNELRFYDADGVIVASRGGDGQGPGEFEYLRALGDCRSGGFVAFDVGWQMNGYTDDGRFVDKWALRAPDGITPYNLACDERGHVLMLAWGMDMAAGPVIGFHATRSHLLLTDTDGAIQADFGEVLVSERLGAPRDDRPHPAGRATRFALHDDRVYVGDGRRFEVEVRGLDGTLLELLRGPSIDLSVTDSIRAEYLRVLLERTPEERRPALRRTEDMEWPDGIPAFVDLRIDSDGVLWLLAWQPRPNPPLRGDAAQTWSLLDPERGYLGDIRLPPRHELLEAGADHLLLLTRGDLDVERVVEVTLERAAVS